MTTAKNLGRFIGVAVLAAAMPVVAQQNIDFSVRGADPDVTAALQQASLLYAGRDQADTDGRDLLAAARADYARLVNALYAEGYYGGVVHIYVDGKEVAAMSPFAAPRKVGSIRVDVDPGPQFKFNQANVTPLSPGTTSPEAFRSGMAARSTVVRDAVDAAVSDWRDAGHAKAAVAGQNIVADHRNSTLDANVRLSPGPLVRFGQLIQTTASAVRAERIARIAGLPTGKVFSPAQLDLAAERLRRTGAFSSVTMTEADALGPGDTMDIDLAVADEKPHRFGFGFEVASLDGASLSGYWLHRNLFGGAERLRLDGEISGIDGTLAGMDATASARLDIPAAFGTDNDAFVMLDGGYIDDPGYWLLGGTLSAGVHRRFSPTLEGEASFAYTYAAIEDDFGKRRFSFLSLPTSLTWDRRNDALDPTSGTYVGVQAEPFYEFNRTTLGARGYLDARTYFGVADDKVVFAARAQVGYVAGLDAGLGDVPPDYLFYSGGGGTVRGFPYQSMGVDLGGGDIVGGRAFLGGSAELRYRVSETIGLVGFADAGYVGSSSFMNDGDWQIGAGIGGRYYTGLGPIRVDLAMPVSGPGADDNWLHGAQFYLGIGQSF